MEYTITTERLGMRQWRDEDLVHFIYQNLDAEVMRYFPWLNTPGQTVESYEKLRAHFDDHGYTFFATDYLLNGQFIGMIGLYNTRFEAEFTPCVEIGWRLNKGYWGRGLATEGARACLDFAFNRIGLEKVVSFTSVVNKPSIRVMQKIGMTYKGNFDHPYVAENDVLRPHVLYEINANQFYAS